MKLIFVRHGESQANLLHIISNRDTPHLLTENGRGQALALAKNLRVFSVRRIYTSPIPRARQTGELLSLELSAPLEFVDALREPDCGVLEGRGDPDAWAEHKYWLETWLSGIELEKGPQGGETCDAVRGRFTQFIGSLIYNFHEMPFDFVFVTHGEVMLLGLPVLVPGLDYQTIQRKGLGFAEMISLDVKDGQLTCV
jgi:broad specificity phosphatase PhoE